MRAPPWGPSPAQEKGGWGGVGITPVLSSLERRVQTRVSGGASAHGNLYGSEGQCPGRPSCHSLPCSQRDLELMGSAGIVSSLVPSAQAGAGPRHPLPRFLRRSPRREADRQAP